MSMHVQWEVGGGVGSWTCLTKGPRCLPKGHKAGLQGSLADL